MTMERLRREFESLGLKHVETFIASGNVIFDGPRDGAAFEKKIEAHLRAALGWEVATFLRTDAELAAIVRHPAFDAARRGAGACVIGFLRAPLDAAARRALDELASDDDRFHLHGRELYWLCRTRQSQSEFSNAVFEKATKVRSTFRNLNTLERLSAKHPPKRGA